MCTNKIFMAGGNSERCLEWGGGRSLTLPVPSRLVPTPDIKGGSAGPPAISKTLGPTNLKFCMVLRQLRAS